MERVGHRTLSWQPGLLRAAAPELQGQAFPSSPIQAISSQGGLGGGSEPPLSRSPWETRG